jgi:hypothetical protein
MKGQKLNKSKGFLDRSNLNKNKKGEEKNREKTMKNQCRQK